MKFQKVKSISISDTVAEEIEQRILAGDLIAGNKLPPERELADQFNVSRPSIREAINKLQAKGIIRKVPGGGNYITDEVGSSFADPLFDLITSNKGAYEILELRFAVEGLSAYYAAKRATKIQQENIKEKYLELVKQHEFGTPEQEAAADVAFHIAIAEASNNPAIIHLMRNLLNVLQISISSYFRETKGSHQKRLPEEHGEIMDAILKGKSIHALECMRKHIAGVEKRIARLRYDESKDSEDLSRVHNLTDLIHELNPSD